MAKYVHNARSFYDDREIEELLLNQPPFGRKKLDRIAASRGLHLCSDLSDELVVRRLSCLRWSWRQFLDLVSLLDKDDPEERRAAKRMSGVGMEVIEEIASSLKSEGKEGNYNISKRDDSTISIVVDYVERDPTKAKWGQKQKKEVTLNVVQSASNGLEIVYNDTKKAKEIIGIISAKARKKSEDSKEELKESLVNLSGKSPKEKTQFFIELSQGIPGYELQTVVEVKLDRRLEDGGSDKSKESELENLVKTAALSGDDVLSSKLYSQLNKDGYYIAFIRWIVKSKVKVKESKLFLLEAGFSHPISGEDFYFDAKKQAAFADSSLGYTYSVIEKSDKQKLRKLLVDRAFQLSK